MILLLGKKKDLLASFISNLSTVKSVVISSEKPDALKEYLNTNRVELIIYYAESFERSIGTEYIQLRSEFKDIPVWSIHNSNSEKKAERLSRMGFDHVIHIDTDLEKELRNKKIINTGN